jgi:hypothetical protein
MCVIGALVTLALSSGAGTSTTTPGTAAQVKALVAASARIKTLTPTVSGELANAPDDFSWNDYPKLGPVVDSSCNTLTACVYGDTASKNDMVVLGDSHALAWLPALVPVANANKYKLILLWMGVCPPADLSVDYPTFGYPAGCNAWRKSMITDINSLHPAVIVLAERTTDMQRTATTFFDAAEWKAGLVTTINQLKYAKTKIAVLEDTVYFDTSTPTCLSVHPSSVRTCAVPFPNPRYLGLQSAEQAAAKATGALYVKTQNWFCTSTSTSTCSAVIGNFIPFVDSNHISFAYAQYLSGVMKIALKPLF